MITHPSGTILVSKVNGSNDFVEETLELSDLTQGLIGTSGSLIYSNGVNLTYLAPGSTGNTLTMTSGGVQWAEVAIPSDIDGGVPSSVYTASEIIDGGEI